MRKLELIADLEPEELRFAATSKFRRARDLAPASRAMRLRYQKGDYRRAEAISRAPGGDRLQLVKSLISRGLIDDARSELTLLRNELGSDSALETEISLQEFRCADHACEYLRALEIAESLERSPDLSAVSRMVVHQIRANALFELRDFGRSWRDFRALESLAALYPFSPARLYASTNEVRLLLRANATGIALDTDAELRRRWRLSLPSDTLDPLLTLLRSRIEILRFEGKDFAREAAATILISRALGDDLYTALGRFDLLICRGNPDPNSWLGELAIDLERHPKIRFFHENLIRTHANAFTDFETLTETTRAMARALALRQGSETAFCEVVAASRVLAGANRILLTGSSAQIDLARGRAETIAFQPKTLAILHALLDGHRKKETLFRAVWGLPFGARRDAILRTALSRVREQTGVIIEVEGEHLHVSAETLLVRA